MAKCEPGYIVTSYCQFINGVDNVLWVSQGSNFVHKGKEMCGACSKYEGEMYTCFGGQI
jgi:hypothetical protein